MWIKKILYFYLISLILISCGGLTGLGGRTGEEPKRRDNNKEKPNAFIINNSMKEFKPAILHIKKSFLRKVLKTSSFDGIYCRIDSSEYPIQPIDSERFILVVDLPPKKEIPVFIKKDITKINLWQKKAHAQFHERSVVIENRKGNLKVSGGWIEKKHVIMHKNHKIHDGLYRFEGPGWESDKIAWRLYFDERCAVDIFGKRKQGIVLPLIDLPGSKSYHELSDWGMDILKVGDTLGAGGGGFWKGNKCYHFSKAEKIECIISADGPVFAKVKLIFHGLITPDNNRVNLTWEITTYSGCNFSKNKVYTQKGDWKGNFAAGLVKHTKSVEKNLFGKNRCFFVLSTWGPQALAPKPYKNLGLAIMAMDKDLEKNVITDNEAYLISKKTREFVWWSAAFWSGGPNPPKNKKEFIEDISNICDMLSCEFKIKEANK